MKYDLSQEDIKDAFLYDHETGLLCWNNAIGQHCKKGLKSGSIHHSGRIVVGFKGYLYLAHILAWMHFYGEWPKGVIDHMNGDPQDNRILNLRDVTVRENMQNCHFHRCGRLPGIRQARSKNSKRWEAYISRKDKQYHLGTFDTKELAYAAYTNAVKSPPWSEIS